MKTTNLMSLAVLAAAALTSSSSWGERPHENELSSVAGAVSLFWTDAAGNPPASESTPIYDARFHNPALAPDGHQLTRGELDKVAGHATAKCVGRGTEVRLHLTGLVPNGVYTVWTLVFNGPFPAGPNGVKPAPFGNLVGLGPMGAHDGSENHFQADANGEGDISALVRPGPLYAEPPPPFLPGMYDIQDCLLNEVGFHFVGVYHFNGQTYGPGPGYNHGAVEQFGFMFEPGFDYDSDRAGHVITSSPTADAVYDANGKPAKEKTSAIYSDSSGACDHTYPILKPDGSPMPYSLWKSVKGSATAQC